MASSTTGEQDQNPLWWMFRCAWFFFCASALLGLVLRVHVLHPLPLVHYGNILHTHSHIAFLGWVYNAFFALALNTFTPPGRTRSYIPLFCLTQVAVVGMLASYPVQGYGAVSIAFSTLHMICAAVFAWRLWREHEGSAIARRYLGAALIFMVVSGAGPLSLGPLAALGFRDAPAYTLSIYFYLHFQYNGWFLFFLKAVLFQRARDKGAIVNEVAARKSVPWFVVGFLLSFALSTLWLNPPMTVFVIAGLGGAAQIVGCVYLLRALRPFRKCFLPAGDDVAAVLVFAALTLFLLKNLMQFVASAPFFLDLTHNRHSVIGFLHLVFLGVVTPMIVAWARTLGWMQKGRWSNTGVLILFLGVAATEFLLIYSPLAFQGGLPATPRLQESLVAASALIFIGILLLIPVLWPNTSGSPSRRGED